MNARIMKVFPSWKNCPIHRILGKSFSEDGVLDINRHVYNPFLEQELWPWTGGVCCAQIDLPLVKTCGGASEIIKPCQDQRFGISIQQQGDGDLLIDAGHLRILSPSFRYRNSDSGGTRSRFTYSAIHMLVSAIGISNNIGAIHHQYLTSCINNRQYLRWKDDFLDIQKLLFSPLTTYEQGGISFDPVQFVLDQAKLTSGMIRRTRDDMQGICYGRLCIRPQVNGDMLIFTECIPALTPPSPSLVSSLHEMLSQSNFPLGWCLIRRPSPESDATDGSHALYNAIIALACAMLLDEDYFPEAHRYTDDQYPPYP